MEENLGLFFGLSFLTALIAFAFAFYLYLWVRKQKVGNQRIIEVSALIKKGADTFIRREYRILFLFALIVALVLFVLMPNRYGKEMSGKT